MDRRLFDDLVLSRDARAGSAPTRAWPLSLAVHAMGLAVLASISADVVKEDKVEPAPPGPVIFHSGARPQPGPAPRARAGTPLHRRPDRSRPVLPIVVDALPVVRADGPVADPEPDLLESPVGEGPLCLGCAAGTPGGEGARPAGSGSIDGSGTAPRRVGGAIREPRRIQGGPPSYPDLARRARVQGDVVLECVIDADGRVTDLRVVSGHPLLVEGATDAVRRWVYTPTTLNGQPIAVVLSVTVKFALDRR